MTKYLLIPIFLCVHILVYSVSSGNEGKPSTEQVMNGVRIHSTEEHVVEGPPPIERTIPIKEPLSVTKEKGWLEVSEGRSFEKFQDRTRQAIGLRWNLPDKLSKIDLGLETHDFNSINRFFPSNSRLLEDSNSTELQYHRLSPSAMDHNGAFLRFKW